MTTKQTAPYASTCSFMEAAMSYGETAVLVMIIAAFAVFMATLGWVSRR